MQKKDLPWARLLCDMESGIVPWQGSTTIAAIDLYCLTGYVGSLKQWKIFQEDWNRILMQASIPFFHAKDFFGRDQDGKRIGRYKNWSDQKAATFLDGLLESIDARRIFPVGGAIDIAAFNALSYGERKFLTGGFHNGKKWLTTGASSKPYFLAFQHILIEAAHQTKIGKKTNFIFDRQNVFAPRALETFNESWAVLTPDLRQRLGGAIFHAKDDVPPLQAADLYAHCWYSELSHSVTAERRKASRQLASQTSESEQ